jgi:serine/threonine-protein kinase RsbW
MTLPLFYEEIFIQSTVTGLKQCLNVISEVDKIFCFNFELTFALHTVIVESVENAIIHGNKSNRNAIVRFLISIDKSNILVEIEDEGEGFDINKVPSPIKDSTIYKECGRGIFIIKNLSSNVFTLGRGNILRINIEK